MGLTGIQFREQIISFALQTIDQWERESSETQKLLTTLQEQVEKSRPSLASAKPEETPKPVT